MCGLGTDEKFPIDQTVEEGAFHVLSTGLEGEEASCAACLCLFKCQAHHIQQTRCLPANVLLLLLHTHMGVC